TVFRYVRDDDRVRTAAFVRVRVSRVATQNENVEAARVIGAVGDAFERVHAIEVVVEGHCVTPYADAAQSRHMRYGQPRDDCQPAAVTRYGGASPTTVGVAASRAVTGTWWHAGASSYCSCATAVARGAGSVASHPSQCTGVGHIGAQPDAWI